MCALNDDREDGERCPDCGEPIQSDCDAEPYDPELEARIDDALERGEP